MTPDSSHTRRTHPSALPLLLTPGLMLVTVVAHAGGVLDFKAAGPVAAREDDLIVMILGLMLIVLVPLGFLWFYTDWAERSERSARRADRAGATSEELGRSAGRVAGNAFLAGKRALRRRDED